MCDYLFETEVEFEPEYVLSRHGDKILPVDELKEALINEGGEKVSFKEESLTGLSFTCAAGSREELEKILQKVLLDAANVSLIHRNELEKEETAEEVSLIFSGRFRAVYRMLGSNTSEATAVLEKILKRVGWSEFKALCEELTAISPQLRLNGIEDSFRFQNYLFSVNYGYGFTTALNDFAELAASLELFAFDEEGPKVKEYRLCVKETAGRTTLEALLESLESEDMYGRVIGLDISEFMERSRRQELKLLLENLLELKEHYIFVFRVPFLEPDAFGDVASAIADIMYLRTISVTPVGDEELKLGAQLRLGKFGYEMAEDSGEIFFARLREEKNDGRFYGIRSVENIVYEMLWLKAKADSRANSTDRVISESEIESLSKTYKKQAKSGFDELDELIGMEKIAGRIREIVAQVKFGVENGNGDRPCIHMRFSGAPGTGKTTVARIVGRIFAENGILRNGYFFEYSARELCGEYVGQTAPKTAAICRDAYGSVLFIDEAYALYQGKGDTNDYGREALVTLISEMENHRSDMVVVMAGYKEDMEKLMESNSGLRSRMPFLLEFESYTREQLRDIFMLFVNKHYKYAEGFKESVTDYFNTLAEDYMRSEEFANARFVRNLYERCCSKAALRTSMAGGCEILLTKEDFAAAITDKEFSERLMMKNKLGF